MELHSVVRYCKNRAFGQQTQTLEVGLVIMKDIYTEKALTLSANYGGGLFFPPKAQGTLLLKMSP